MGEERFRGVLQNQLPVVGDAAPDFQLPGLIAGVRKPFRLSEYLRQRKIILAFYPSNWEQVSASQLAGYQRERARFLANDGEIVGICVDSIMNTTAWERVIGPLDFVLCSDFWPQGEVAKQYGLFEEAGPHAGSCQRAVFIINREGNVAFRKIYNRDLAAPVDEILDVLENG